MKQLMLRGFTIVELAVIIAVLSILVSIVYVSYTKSLQDTAVASLEEDLRQARDQLELERSEGSPYPASINDANNGNGLEKGDDTNFSYQKDGDGFCLSATSTKYPQLGPLHVTSSSSVAEGGC